MADREVYAFGEFLLDASERQLSKAGQAVLLAPKAHDVLVALLRKAGRLVTKSELLAQVWPDSFVEEGILSVHVSSLRKALDDGQGTGYIQTVPRAGYRFVGVVTRSEPDREASPGRFSVAVLPARRFSHEILSGRDWPTGLALADALIDRLGRFPQILVRPTRAVYRYNNVSENPASIGQALRVDTVLECAFVRTAGRVQVSARLVRSRDGGCLWRREYDELGTDVLAIADAIAGSVAEHLGCTSSESGPWRGAARQSLPPGAYECFGLGRSHLLSASMFEVPPAIEAFRAAIALAPEYAGAHAGLALAYCAQAEYRLRSQSEAFSDARAAALRALAMDDASADAQAALGAVVFLSDWNWIGAERSLQRALAIHPNHTEAYLLYGRLLEALGRLDEGLEMKLRALERDLFSPLVHLQISMSYFFQRRYDLSIEWANKTLELEPRHPHALEHLAAAYWKKGDLDRSMEANIQHAQLHGAPAEALEVLKKVYASDGRAGVGRLVLERAARQPQAFPDIQLAIFHGEAGDLDSAYRHLDHALECHDPALVNLAVGPQWDALRSDASRFDQRLGRMGLSPVC